MNSYICKFKSNFHKKEFYIVRLKSYFYSDIVFKTVETIFETTEIIFDEIEITFWIKDFTVKIKEIKFDFTINIKYSS